MNGYGGEQAERRYDYRDRIRAAKDLVDAAAAESERLVASQASAKRQRVGNGSSSASTSSSMTSEQYHQLQLQQQRQQQQYQQQYQQQQQQQQPLQEFSEPWRPLNIASPQRYVDPSFAHMAGLGESTQRSYPPELDPWLAGNVVPPPLTPSRHGEREYTYRRNEIASFAETESIYSQPDTGYDGPGTFLATSSHASRRSDGSSSLGDIPDFPVPGHTEDFPSPGSLRSPVQSTSQLNVNPYARTRDIPPPTARRGTESYYSHRSVISPIAEEPPQSGTSPRRIRESIATISEQSLEHAGDATFLEDGDESRYLSPLSGTVSPGLLRQASIGRAAKPQVTLVKSPSAGRSREVSRKISRSGESGSFETGQSATKASSSLGAAAGDSSSQSLTYPPMPPAAAATVDRAIAADRSSSAPRKPELTPVVEQILGGLQKGGALPTNLDTPGLSTPLQAPRTPATPFEDRMSTTSLTDMIRRATRVRTNLDKGKTASRIMMNDYLSSSRERLGGYDNMMMVGSSNHIANNMAEKPIVMDHYREMAHPVARSAGDESEYATERSAPMESRAGTHSDQESLQKSKKPPRRCLGMPQWLFVLLLVLIIILVAAAIIIPVELVVVPRQAANSGSSTSNIANCPKLHACQNNGTSVIFNGTCSCACINGYTGTNCQNGNDPSCAYNTSTISAPLWSNLTLGSALPDIISAAQPSFGIDLNVTALAGAFSSINFRCSDENALVTFLPYNKRRSLGDVPVWGVDAAMPLLDEVDVAPAPTVAPSLLEIRQPEVMLQQITSSGILLDNNSATPTATTTATATASTADASFTSFAQAAVLWILQETSIDTAQSARSMLDKVLNAPTFTPTTITVVDGVTINLASGMVSVPGVTEGNGKGIN